MKNVMITEDYYEIESDRPCFTKAIFTITKYSLFMFFSWYYVSTVIEILN